jgi:hypothetical protein
MAFNVGLTIDIAGAETLTTNGVTVSAVSFEGAGTLNLADDLTTEATGSLNLTGAGSTFNTNNHNISTNIVLITAALTANLGSSTITCNSKWEVTAGTVNAGTSHIIVGVTTGFVEEFEGDGETYNDVTIRGDLDGAVIIDANTFANLTLTGYTATAVAQVSFDNNQTITGTFTANGYAANYRLLVASNTLHTARTINAATVVSTYTDFRDITGAGAGSWNLSAGTAGDCGGNTGFTFPVPRTVYASEITGNIDWSNNKWAATSGGIPAVTNFPRPQDTAVFNADSVDVPGVVIGMDSLSVSGINATAITNSPTFQHFSVTQTMVYLYGSLELGTCVWDVDQTYMYGQGAETLSADSVIGGDLFVDAYTGAVTLESDIVLLIISGDLTLTSGIVNANDYDITAGTFVSSVTTYQRSLVMGSGTITLDSTAATTKWNVAAVNLAITPDDSTIVFTNSTANGQTFAGAGFAYYDFTIQGSGNYTTTISGTNTFHDMTIDRSQAAKTLSGAVTCTISHLFVPTVGVTQVTITNTDFTKTSGLVALKYMTISGSSAGGGATFLAGVAPPSVDGGGNAGWTFADFTAPTVTTAAATSMDSDGANLNGNIGSLGSFSGETLYAYFEYGLTAGYGTETSEVAKTVVGDFADSVTGLTADTLYHYRAVVRYNGSEYSYGADVEFTTSGAPVVETSPATNIAVSSATLQGVLTSLGTYSSAYVYFEYGLTAGYGSITDSQTFAAPGSFNADVSSLAPYETYHFRAVALYSTASKSYGSDVTFTLLPEGSSTTITIIRAAVFTDYLETGDMLFTAEVYNKYTNYYPNEESGKWFTMEILDPTGATILGASPLSNWGDRPSSVYYSAANVTAMSMVYGDDYYVRIIAHDIAGTPSDQYQLQDRDWNGIDKDSLDYWCIACAINMEQTDDMIGQYITVVTDVNSLVITEKAGGYFTKGIPGIGQVRPNLISTSTEKAQFTTGIATSDYDPTDWSAYVGAKITADATVMGALFNTDGRTALAWLFGLIVIIIMIIGVVMGGKPLGIILLAVPILAYGGYLRVIDIQWIVIPSIVIMGIFAIRQFVFKTT